MGGGVVKKRVALSVRGNSGSARALLATNRASRWCFVFGLEKNECANLTAKEVEALQQFAANLLRLSNGQLDEHSDAVLDAALLDRKGPEGLI